jgi:hypothetical protein
MKFAEPSRFTDPDATVRKLMKIANAKEPAQDGRIYIELVKETAGEKSPLQHRAGPDYHLSAQRLVFVMIDSCPSYPNEEQPKAVGRDCS